MDIDDILFCIENADAVDNDDLQKLAKAYRCFKDMEESPDFTKHYADLVDQRDTLQALVDDLRSEIKALHDEAAGIDL